MQRAPERARELMLRLDSSVQKQLGPALAAYAPGVLSYAQAVTWVCAENQSMVLNQPDNLCVSISTTLKVVFRASVWRGSLSYRSTCISGSAQRRGFTSPGRAASGSASISSPPAVAAYRRPPEARPRVNCAHPHGSLSGVHQARSSSSFCTGSGQAALVCGARAFPAPSPSCTAAVPPQCSSCPGQ